MPIKPLCRTCASHARVSSLQCVCLRGLDAEHQLACIDREENREFCPARVRAKRQKKGYWIAKAVKKRNWRNSTAPFHIGNRVKVYRPARKRRPGWGGRAERD